ncbi:MAG: vitamin K epoxide reductase family protein [Anaerolineales bacterium]
MKFRFSLLIILGILLIVQPVMQVFGQTEERPPVVHAVFFYASSCPYCHQVITEDFPPLLERFGEQLQIFLVNVQGPGASEVYWNTFEVYEVPEEIQGAVPMLVVGENVLIGGIEIPERFPTIIEEGIERGGIPWPDIQGLEELIQRSAKTATAAALNATPSPTSTPVTPSPTTEDTEAPLETATRILTVTPQPSETPLPEEVQSESGGSGMLSNEPEVVERTLVEEVMIRIKRDFVGNLASILVLIGMVASLISIGIGIVFPHPVQRSWPDWLIPLLSLAGIGVAGYLSYIEMTNTIAFCGPVGDCNTVQQSQYARIGGFFPVGLLGLVGFIAVAVMWFVYRRGPEKYRKAAVYSLWAMTGFGTLFSTYLTFLEPFVIGATCAWCLTASLIITAQLWVATAMVDAFQR